MSPSWAEGAVVYQVYPRAFADGNGDGVGDLPGVVRRLDHFSGGADALGVDAIWLSPFYPHGGVDGGYDVTDFTDVSPEFGSLADFDALLAACHERGVRVLLDLVTGHTSDRHPWFVAARPTPGSPKRDWYLWADARPDGRPPSNWVSEFGGSAWTADPSGQSYLHSFYAEQPDLNWRNPAVRAAMGEAMRFWLDRGVDGFRVDAIEFLIKDPWLRDNPPAGRVRAPWSAEPGGLRRRWTRNQPGLGGALRELRTVTDAYPDRVLLGELYAPADRVARTLTGRGGPRLHAGLDHQLAKSPWDAAAFRRALVAAERHLAPPLVPAWALSNHDLSRHATRWGVERSRAAALILLTMRGVVCLYQGEEVGMIDAPAGRALDRVGRDGSRGPMTWQEVAAQRDDPVSLLSWYRQLIALRGGSPALRAGTLSLLRGLPPGILGYYRQVPGERLTVLVNMGARSARIGLEDAGRVSLVAHTEPRGRLGRTASVVELDPDAGVIVRHA